MAQGPLRPNLKNEKCTYVRQILHMVRGRDVVLRPASGPLPRHDGQTGGDGLM